MGLPDADKMGETSSDVIAGFALGYQWFLIFENRKRGGSLIFRKFQ